MNNEQHTPPDLHRRGTRIFRIGDEEHANYIDLVVAQWRHLTWRHAGFGALQAYLAEGETSELRVHVWHPGLVRPGIAESGLCHDHRFDMRSIVLAGTIGQCEVWTHPNENGAWQASRVVHAREAMARGGSFHMAPELTPDRYDRSWAASPVHAGHGYTFPKFLFHETHSGGPTVTLVRKIAQVEARARILHPHGVPIVNAFEDPMPPEAFAGALVDGLEALEGARGAL